MKKDYTDITVVLDRSGSMASIKGDTEGGFNQFVEDQRKLPGLIKLSLYQFDDKYEPVYVERPVANVEWLHLVPRGYTALYDAVGKAVVQTGERLAALPESERPDKVVFVIITDGEENASKEFTADMVKASIKHQREAYSWQFTFLGADITAMEQASALGIALANSAKFAHSGKGAKNVFRSLSSNLASFHTTGFSGSLGYTDDQREDMDDNKTS